MARKKFISDQHSREIGERIRQLYEEQGLTQADLARDIGVVRQSLSKYINGEALPDAVTLMKIARRFNTSTDYILGLTNMRTNDPQTAYVQEHTGLSDAALEALHSIKIGDRANDLFDLGRVSFINQLLLEPDFRNGLSLLHMAYEIKGKVGVFKDIDSDDIVRLSTKDDRFGTEYGGVLLPYEEGAYFFATRGRDMILNAVKNVGRRIYAQDEVWQA